MAVQKPKTYKVPSEQFLYRRTDVEPQNEDIDAWISQLEQDLSDFKRAYATFNGMVNSLGGPEDSLSLRGMMENQKLILNQMSVHIEEEFTLLATQDAQKLILENPQTGYLQRKVERLGNQYTRDKENVDVAFDKCSKNLQQYPPETIGKNPRRIVPESSDSSNHTSEATSSEKVIVLKDLEFIEYNEEEEAKKIIEEQNRQIKELLAALVDLRELFAQQADMVVEQGEILADMEQSLLNAEQATHEAVTQLAKAQMIDIKRFVNKATLAGMLIGGAIGAVAGLVLIGPIGGLVGGGAGVLIGGAVGRMTGKLIAKKLTRAAEREYFRAELGSQWVRDKDAPRCMACNKSFSPIKRRTHCRQCGGCFCHSCCKWKRIVDLPGVSYDKKVQVCYSCSIKKRREPTATEAVENCVNSIAEQTFPGMDSSSSPTPSVWRMVAP